MFFLKPNYSLALINLTVFVIFIIFMLGYKHFYPKRKINFLILLITISIIPILSIFRPGVYESGDFTIHIYRTMDFYASLSEGNLIPSWAENLNATYGYPLFLFNYTLPYYLISLFHSISFSFIFSLKIFLALSFILSGIFMYLFGKTIFNSRFASFTAAIFYLFAPYHLITLHFKVSIGEISVFTIIPLFFLFIQKFLKTKRTVFLLLSGLTFAMLMLSHVVIALFTGAIGFFYLLFFFKEKLLKKIFFIVPIYLIGLLISAYNYLPTLIYKDYLLTGISKLSTIGFPSILDLLYSPWRIGFLFQGPRGEISNLIGYSQLFIIVITIYLLIKKQKLINKFVYMRFWFIALLIVLFLITPYSKFIWDNLPLLNLAGAHRLLILLTFCISILSGYFVLNVKDRKYIYVIIFFTIFYTILNWGNRGLIPNITDENLRNNLPLSTAQGEGHFYANTKWANVNKPWFSNIPIKHLEILSGKGEITQEKRNTTFHSYNFVATTSVVAKENTLFFPGWITYLDGKPIKTSVDNSGVITFKIPSGTHNLNLIYEDIFPYNIIKVISLVSFLALIFGISVLLAIPVFRPKS